MTVLKIIGIVLAAILVIIGIIILLPVDVIIQEDKKTGFKILFRFLGKLFGEEPDPNNPIVKEIKKITGVDKLIDSKTVKENIGDKGVTLTANEMITLLKLFLNRIFKLLPKATLHTLKIDYICAGDAAAAAFEYGTACAVIYPLKGIIEDNVKRIRKEPEVNISCDFDAEKPQFYMNVILRFMLFSILAAFIYIVKENVKMDLNKEAQNNGGK